MNQYLNKNIKEVIIKIFNTLGLDISRKITSRKLASYSQFNEQTIILGYLDKLDKLNRYCVDIGASDGASQSNTVALYLSGWRGLSVEYNGENFAKLALNYKNFPNVNLSKNKVTPINVVNILKSNNVPKEFGLLNLDIDSYDYFVLEKILSSYRPSLLCVEINEMIPPPIKFTVNWDPNFKWIGGHFFGQSLSQLHTLTSKVNYELVELHYNNAFFIPKEINFTKSLTPEEAYQKGYLNKPDRKEKHPYSRDVEEVLNLSPDEALKFINRYFQKYKGKFTLSL